MIQLRFISIILPVFLLVLQQLQSVAGATGGISISFNWNTFTNPGSAPNTAQYDLIKKALINVSYFFNEIVQLNKETAALTFNTINGLNNCSPEATDGYVTPSTTDLHIFVRSYENGSDTQIMTGKFCTIQDQSRPKFGIIKVNFAKIDHPSMDTNLQNSRHMQYYRLAQKSLQSILGFDNDLFSKFIKSAGVLYTYSEVVLTVNSKTYVSLQSFKDYAQSYYQNYKFAYQLGIQFEVVNGVTVWRKRYLYNDVSTANSNLSDYIDKLYSQANTLLLQSTGWYTSVKSNRVDFNNWGQSFNSFLDTGNINTCSTTQDVCSQTYMSIANCASDVYIDSNLAEVPFVSCTNMNYAANLAYKYVRGQIFDEKSKCFTSSITNTVERTLIPYSCHQYKCLMETLTLQIFITGAQTITCTPALAGTQINLVTVTDVEGKITCPNFYEFCALKYACPFDCSTNGYCSRGMCTCNTNWAGYGCNKFQNIVDEQEIAQSSCDTANGYYLAPNRVCLKCTDPCTKCYSQGNGNCTECKSGYYLLGNTCVADCPDGYYHTIVDGQDVCLNCAIGCTKCVNTATNCINCPVGQYEMPDKTCVASCTPISDYYQNETTKKCEPCDLSCNQCTAGNSDMSCVNCKNPGEFKNPNNFNICEACPDGTYGDTVTFTCVNCNSPCKTCVTNADNCTSCLATKGPLRKDGKCGPCDPGQYNDTATDKCENCNANCLTCVDTAVKCTSCVNGAVLPGDTCPPCPIGQYYTGAVCLPCDSQCYKCSGPNNNNCIACLAPKYLRLDGTCGACDAKQYVDANGACQNCHSTCLTCVGGSANTNCTSCATPGEYLTNPSLVCGTCATQEYADPVDQKCKPCDTSCNKCTGSGPDKCVACVDPTKFKDKTTQQCITCPQFYYGSSVTGYCEPCDSTCQTCNGSNPTDCITCKPPMAKHANGTCANCDTDQYVDVNNTCQDCDITCATCNNSNDPSNCTKCKNPGEFLSSNVPPGKCGPCTAQQYGDVATNLCLPCDATCDGCTGGTKSDCKACANPLHFKNPLNNNYCEACPPKYFGNTTTGMCEPCHSSCQTCSNSNSTGCLSCPIGTYLHADGTCAPCLSNQYVQNGTTCQDCDVSCATCNGGGSTNCTSCKNPGEFLTLPNLICGICQDQEFGDPITKKCTPCDISCNKCAGAGKGDCIQCAKPNEFKDPQNNNYCQVCSSLSYGDATTGYCVPCHNSCTICYGPTQNDCTACQGGKYLQDGHSCVSVCPIGTYPVGPPDNVCKACEDSNCYICSASKTCIDCKSPYLLQGKICVLTCEDGYYQSDLENCSPCHPTCKKCGPSTSKCVECAPGLYIQGEKCVSQCESGYYLSNGQKECLPCEVSSCKVCTSANTCQTCSDGYELKISDDANNPGQKKYECIIKCDVTCKTCELMYPDKCTSCLTGKVLQGTKCQDKCDNGFYKDPKTQNICIECQADECIQEGDQCHYTCETCYGSGYADCLTCKANRRIQTPFAKNIGECNCPATTTDVLKEACDEKNATQDQLQSATIGMFVTGTIFSVMTSIITSNPLFVFLFLDTCQNASLFRYLDRKNGLSFDQLVQNLKYSNIFTLFPNPNSWSPEIEKSLFTSPSQTRMLDLFAPNSLNIFDKQSENKKISLDGKTPYFIINIFVLILLNIIIWIIAAFVRRQNKHQNNNQADSQVFDASRNQHFEENGSQNSGFSKKQNSNLSNKKSKKLGFKESLNKYMYVSIPMVFSILTIGEVFVITFYAFFNFKADSNSVGIISNILVFFVMGYYFFVIGYISKNFVRQQTKYEELKEEIADHKNKLILFWEILESKRTKQRLYPVIYCVKKIIQGMFYAVIVDSPRVQIVMLMVLSLCYWIYIVLVRPFKRNLYKILAITVETIILVLHLVFLLMISQSNRSSQSYTPALEIRFVFAVITLVYFLLFIFIVFSVFQFLKFFISYSKRNQKINPNSVQKVTPEDFSYDYDMSKSYIKGDNYLVGYNRQDDDKIRHWNTNRVEGVDQTGRYQSSRLNLNNSIQQRSFMELRGLDQSMNNQLNNSMNQHKLIEMQISGYQSNNYGKVKKNQDKSSSSDNDNYSTDQEKNGNRSQFKNQLKQQVDQYEKDKQKKVNRLILSSEEDQSPDQLSNEDQSPQLRNQNKVINLDQQYDKNAQPQKQIRRVQTSLSQHQKGSRNQQNATDNKSSLSDNNNKRVNSAAQNNHSQPMPNFNNKSKHILQSIMTLTRTSGFASDKNE